MREFRVFDGVALAMQGDTFVSLWKSPALVDRVRWHGALLEQHVARQKSSALALMIVMPSSSPPVGEARVESNAVVRRIAPKLRLAVTAALGDSIQMQIVRTVMRGMFLLSGNAKRLVVVSTEAEGIERVHAAGEASTPPRHEIEASLRALHEMLAEEPVQGLSTSL